ncbi:GNAT family N-acetyltransferase [Formosa sp. 3Alg 14/1]|uniref:GNAT family N-acetyltransferase n=1 Tax=Formosa sp. 3Alg 14/1 TaxID=3382190 RepID=UPI0039BEC57C
MLTYKRIKSTEHIDFLKAWNLYETSFPENERRHIEGQRHALGLKNYHFDIVLKDDLFVGILFWWDFKTLQYIEHIAISPNRQNKGLGSEIMIDVINRTGKNPIILEVEPPITEIQKKRIQFYNKLGFKINDYNYTQPPLQESTEAVRLHILSFPRTLNLEEYNTFITTYHAQIFSHMKI